MASLSTTVNDNEILGRYLTHRSHFSGTRVTARAFEPYRVDKSLSVFRIEGLEMTEIWDLGQRKIIAKSKTLTNLYGLVKVTAIEFINHDLIVNPDAKPSRHTNIIGWPGEWAQIKLITLELAAGKSPILNTPTD